ncbi:Transmembrane emp24 domain-containing protein p24delta9 [Linum grandiflorum]
MAIHELFFILIFTALATLFHESQSLRFEIQSSHTKCITEDIKANALTVGKYTVINPIDGHPLADHLKLTVRVTSSYGNTFHTAENVESGQFAFTASETGDYMACFYAAGHYPAVTSTVDFEWRTGVAAKDWSSIAKKGSVEAMELEVKKLYETTLSMQEEILWLRQREEEMQVLNRSTNTTMGWLGMFSLLVSLSVAAFQFWHLKTFFEKKKII